jgi:GNAT superfamily N-acetyltransferase
MKPEHDISLRPITDADRELLLRIYEGSRETELGAVQWDENMKRVFIEHQFDAQDAHYRKHYAGATYDIIVSDGQPCGRLLVHRGKTQIAIMDLTVLLEFRHRGIGGALVRRVQDEAKDSGRSVRVFLEAFNPHQSFFLKRGFRLAEDDGVSRRYEWHGGESLLETPLCQK